jgi:hypothetical protein
MTVVHSKYKTPQIQACTTNLHEKQSVEIKSQTHSQHYYQKENKKLTGTIILAPSIVAGKDRGSPVLLGGSQRVQPCYRCR